MGFSGRGRGLGTRARRARVIGPARRVSRSTCMNSDTGSHPSMQPPTKGVRKGRSSTTMSRVKQLRRFCGGGGAATKRSSSSRASLQASSASCFSFSGRSFISSCANFSWPCGLSWWARGDL